MSVAEKVETKVIIKEVERPMVSSFTMFEKLDINKLKEEKTFRVSVRKETKTRLSQSFKLGQWTNFINWEVDGFKFHTKKVRNFSNYEEVDVAYFKLLKSQGKEEYFEYLKELSKKLLEQFDVNLDTLTLEVETDRVF